MKTYTHQIGRWFYGRWRTPGMIGAPRLGDNQAGFLHAHKGGAPVLRGESSWRTICGFYVNHPRGFIMIQLGRYWR